MSKLPIVATCRGCGAPYDAKQLEILDACTKCEAPFVPRESDRRPPLALEDMRKRMVAAVEAKDGDVALAVLTEQTPDLYALIGELLRSVVALNGACNCTRAHITGPKPGKLEPCPHRRAMRALTRAGVRQQDIDLVRRSLGLIVA